MKIYDISQEVFGCAVFPGDPAPKKETLSDMASGALYNLTAFSMCAHNGTHIDAPYHFLRDGRTIDAIDLSQAVGYAYVARHDGDVTAADAREILRAASAACPEAAKRILLKGSATVTREAAQVFADAQILLIGNESQTVGSENAPMEVHKILLGKDILLLEGIRFGDVPEGTYLLCAAPINLDGADGAPCRAVLIDLKETE